MFETHIKLPDVESNPRYLTAFNKEVQKSLEAINRRKNNDDANKESS